MRQRLFLSGGKQQKITLWSKIYKRHIIQLLVCYIPILLFLSFLAASFLLVGVGD